MDPEIIGLIIKWGPLVLVGVTFVYYFVIGVIRGTYKVMRRLIYVLLYVALIFIFIDDISKFVLDLNININGAQGVRGFIVSTIESNEAVNNFLGYSSELKLLIIDSPEIILNPILFIVLVFIGLPLSFPIYWIYLIFWHIIMKFVFKREKYEKDEDGNILRNEKGKKIKVRRRKRRMLGGLIRGVQGVCLLCISLLPVNFVNRLYNKAKNITVLEDGKTLCSSIYGVEVNEDICKYLDIYNETIFAKVGGEKSVDKFISDKLTSVEINGERVTLENELGSVVETIVLINDSGLLKLLTSGEINLETFDWNTIDLDKINQAIDKLFGSYLISRISEAGVKYVLNEVMNDKLVEVLKDGDIISKLEYNDATEIKEELQNIVNILKFAVDEGIVELVVDNKENMINIVNSIDASNVETLLNKVLSIRILAKAMPSVINLYGEKYGINVPSSMSSQLNNEIVTTFVNAVKLVKTMELTSLEELSEGDIVENLTNKLFENGALKSNTKEGLATLLYNINSSYLFKDVVSEQANKLLKDKNYKIDARVLKYVDSKEAWMKELSVLEDAFAIYDEYNKEQEIHYEKVTDLLNNLSDTKVLISVLPFAYGELLPKIGIEVDVNKLPSIDFDGDENATKLEFYEAWKNELELLQNIAEAARVLELQSLEDISVDIIKDDDKVEALSTMLGEIYKSELLEEPFALFFVDTINSFVEEYGVEFSEKELLSIDTKEKWKNEFDNINNVLEIDFSDENNITASNLEIVFDSIGSMNLFAMKKVEMLKYAIDMSGFLSQEEFNSISWPGENATQEEINTFYNNETTVLLNIVDKKDVITTLASDPIEDMNTDEVGGLLNDIKSSNILRPIVFNKIATLLSDNGVKDDRDSGSDITNLNNSISSIEDWKKELASIKKLVVSTNDISVTTYNEIVSTARYDKVGGSYIPSNDGDYLKVGESYYFIDSEYLYNIVGDEYKKDESGTYLKVTETKVDELFASIEESDLLKNTRANLLLKAVKTINIVDVPDTVKVATLRDNNYAQYNNEKNVIVEVSKKKNMFDNVSTMKLDSIDVDEIGGLLDVVSTSSIFKPYLVTEIRKVFVANGVKDDRDTGTSVVNLENSIGSVTDWSKELDMIQDMLTITGDSFDDREYYEIITSNRYNASNGEYTQNNEGQYLKVGNNYYKLDVANRYSYELVGEDYKYVQKDSGTYLGVTRVEEMFVNIEYSSLLQNTRANLLIKAVGLININGVNTNGVTVDSLSKTVGDEAYYQYNREVDVFVTFAESIDAVNGLSDITALSDENKTKMGNVLDAMKLSEILKDKYVSTIDTALGAIKGNANLGEGGYNVTFKGKAETNNYRDVVWATEISNLTKVQNNIAAVASFDKNSISTSEKRTATINIIGETLDAMEACALLDVSAEDKAIGITSPADKIADAVVTQLTKDLPIKITNVDKGSHTTWKDAFNAVIQ